jgi:lysophospholipase L1-like esterase
MKTNFKKFSFATLSLVLVSFIFSAFLAEIILRKIYPIENTASLKYRIPHPVLGWTLEPGASYIHKKGSAEGEIQVNYNSAGMRDVSHSVENTSGAFRALILGDSFMEGYSVELKDSFQKQIEFIAAKEGVELEAINMGVGGYGTLQEFLMYKNFGIKYKPNVVLLGFFLGNDVRNNSLSLESILDNKNNGLYLKRGRPFLDSSDERIWKTTQVDFEGGQRRYMSELEKNKTFIRKSALIQLAFRAANNLDVKIKKAFPDSKNNSESQSSREDKNLAKFGTNYCRELPIYTQAWATTKRILSRLKNEVENSGAILYVFSIPDRYEIIEKKTKLKKSNRLMCWKEAPASKRLAGILNELDIGNINLLPHFRNKVNDGPNSLYRRDDGHWNAEGHRIAAELVYSDLKKKGLLPTSNSGISAQ